jgi:ribonuclease HII
MGLKADYRRGVREAGCDEAGRGCLAGPVVAAAVVLPPGWDHPWLNDSKQISPQQRQTVGELIRAEALDWAVAQCDPGEVDHYNILQASILAMHRAVGALKVPPELLLVDGNRFRPYLGIPHICIVGGDGLYRSIAAASILAKTWRDEEMARLHVLFPQYGWLENKGYPTEVHRQALREHGPSPWHRLSFRLDGQPLGDWNGLSSLP